MKAFWAVFTIVVSLLIDQSSKLWVKTHMYLQQSFDIFGDWAKIYFIENEGMAFGLEFGGEYGKLALSLFRVFAVMGLGYLLYYLIKKKEPTFLIVCISLIFAGALGNIIDSLVYGVIFSKSGYYGEVATMFPEGGGYAPVFYGKVVDMLYFPLIEGFWPNWMPFIGGDHFIFFRPIFNVADSCITVGIALILIFQRSFLFAENEQEEIDDKPIEENLNITE